MGAQSLAAAAQSLRHFNRFYTAQIGVLDRDLLGSGRSLAEARVLYELAHHDGLTAGELTKSLAMDAGFLSRMLGRFEKEGLIGRQRSETDGRVSYLTLTEKGRAVFGELDRLSQNAAEAVLSSLPDPDRNDFLTALRNVETKLAAERRGAEVTLRPHRVGDMGLIVHRQAVLYAREYGWNESYEALVSEIVAKFLREFDPQWEACWIAERAGGMVGSVFLVRESEVVAKLRLLYVEPSARGAGTGGKLVDACIAFAREKGYQRIELWTNSVLSDARRLYERAGFERVKEEPHHSFGKDLVGQTWSLDLIACG